MVSSSRRRPAEQIFRPNLATAGRTWAEGHDFIDLVLNPGLRVEKAAPRRAVEQKGVRGVDGDDSIIGRAGTDSSVGKDARRRIQADCSPVRARYDHVGRQCARGQTRPRSEVVTAPGV